MVKHVFAFWVDLHGMENLVFKHLFNLKIKLNKVHKIVHLDQFGMDNNVFVLNKDFILMVKHVFQIKDNHQIKMLYKHLIYNLINYNLIKIKCLKLIKIKELKVKFKPKVKVTVQLDTILMVLLVSKEILPNKE